MDEICELLLARAFGAEELFDVRDAPAEVDKVEEEALSW